MDLTITEKSLIELVQLARENKIEPYLYFLPGLTVEDETQDINNKYDSILLTIAENFNIHYTKLDDNLLGKYITSTSSWQMILRIYGYPDTTLMNMVISLQQSYSKFTHKDADLNFNLTYFIINRTHILGEKCPD